MTILTRLGEGRKTNKYEMKKKDQKEKRTKMLLCRSIEARKRIRYLPSVISCWLVCKKKKRQIKNNQITLQRINNNTINTVETEKKKTSGSFDTRGM